MRTLLLTGLILLTACSASSPRPGTSDAVSLASSSQKPATATDLAGRIRIPLIRSNRGSPLVECVFRGQKFLLIVDTGAQSTTIDARAAQAMNMRSTDTGMYAIGIAPQRMAMRQIEPIRMTMTGFEVMLSPVKQDLSSVRHSYGDYKSPIVVGLLGMDVLGTYDAVIHVGEPAMYLRPFQPR